MHRHGGSLATAVSRFVQNTITLALVAFAVAACSSAPVLPPASEVPLSEETRALIGKKGMQVGAPIYIRIFKEESELEVWKQRDDGRFYHFKTYPICNWSGVIGPKLKEGDQQAPEGFYTVTARQMNPHSSYYLAFNLGFPNAYDRSQGRSGSFIMVHGKCRSAGCYAMTDALMEEIYGIAREALKAGQPNFSIHAFPFRMSDARMKEESKHRWAPFWRVLKRGYDYFETHRIPPSIAVCEHRYVVNAVARGPIDAGGACPLMGRVMPPPFTPLPEPDVMTIAEGNKLKGIVSADVEPTLADIKAAKAGETPGAAASPPAGMPASSEPSLNASR